MELKINSLVIPEAPSFNYEELRQELITKTQVYTTMVYTDDRIKDAKKDRAALNALKKALNDERLKQERSYMMPFNQFKAQIQEIIQIIDKPCAVIDQQIKDYEDRMKHEKLAAITDYWNGHNPHNRISINMVLDPKWLNASVKIEQAQEAMDNRINQITADLSVIDGLEYKLESLEAYLSNNLNLGVAVAKSQKLAEYAKQEEERKQKASEQAEIVPVVKEYPKPIETPAETESEAEAEWIGFEALMTFEQAKSLGSWFKANGIRYRKPQNT